MVTPKDVSSVTIGLWREADITSALTLLSDLRRKVLVRPYLGGRDREQEPGRGDNQVWGARQQKCLWDFALTSGSVLMPTGVEGDPQFMPELHVRLKPGCPLL